MNVSQVAERTARHVEPSQIVPAPAIEGRTAALNAPAYQPVARAQPQPQEVGSRQSIVDKHGSPGKQPRALRYVRSCLKGLATLAIVLVAIVMALITWDYYVTAPWTRDGNVRVQVASVAPQVSGQIVELRVGDNQYVRKGDVLYVIDPFDFEVALRADKAQEQQRAADLQVKKLQSERRQRLSEFATTPEEQQKFAGDAVQAKAAFEFAQQQVAQAEINLGRTRVRSPVDGYVTNLQMRVGDYAHAGGTNISIIDNDSYWIDGYFEETKLARVCIGDRVEAKLLGYANPVLGHVASVTRGIVVSNAAAGEQGLPNVNPVFTWVRLAQRVPVRIAIDHVPPGVPLVSGLTATVTIANDPKTGYRSWLHRAVAEISSRLSDVLIGPPALAGCLPAATTTEQTTRQALPEDTARSGATPDEINPGLAPSIRASPRTGS